MHEKIKEIIDKNETSDFDKLESELKKEKELLHDLKSNYHDLNQNNLISNEKDKTLP